MFSTIREQIEAVFRNDPAARSKLEVLLCYPGLHAILLHRLAHWFFTRNFVVIARLISLRLRSTTRAGKSNATRHSIWPGGPAT